jgi:hypothetical protein
MSCFSLAAAENLAIWVVVLIAVAAIIRLLIPFLFSLAPGGAGMPPIVVQIINIVFWAVVCIAVIMVIFWLLSCLVWGPGLAYFPRR